MQKDRKPNRLYGYNYSWEALYFVTSCVQGRVCHFGEVRDNQMHLNEYGRIAERQWNWMIEKYPYALSHQFVVMPNHIHGIIEINNEQGSLGTGRLSAAQSAEALSMSNGQKIKSVSELMGAYKTTTSKEIRLLGLEDFAWQRSFHDHIIRNEKAFHAISNYIINNPATWLQDSIHPDNPLKKRGSNQ